MTGDDFLTSLMKTEGPHAELIERRRKVPQIYDELDSWKVLGLEACREIIALRHKVEGLDDLLTAYRRGGDHRLADRGLKKIERADEMLKELRK